MAIFLLCGIAPLKAGENSKKPVGIDFFREVKMLSDLKEQQGNVYFIIKQANVEENNYTSDLFLLENGAPRQLTASHDVGEYYLLDDGSILFRNAREAKDKERIRRGEPLSVYVKLSPQMGEAVEAFRLPYSVSNMAFIDEKHFFFTAAYDHSFALLLEESDNDLDRALREKDKHSAYRIFDEIPFWANGRGDVSGKRNHLFYYNEGVIKELSDTFGTVSGLALSNDKQTLVYTSNTYRGKAPRGNQLMALDVNNLAPANITPLKETASYGGVTFVSDSEILLTIQTSINEIGNAGFYRLNIKTNTLDKLYGGDPYGAGNSIGSDVKMGNVPSGIKHDDAGFYYLTTVADHAPLIRVAFKDAAVSFINKGKESILEYLPYKDGFLTIAMVGNQATEIYYLDREGALTQLSHINERLTEEFNIITPQPLTFRNENGVDITGYVVPPAHCEKGKKYPAILDIHGGPKTAFGVGLFHEMQYWANQGYAVIYTNPTGSDGGGNAFANIKARYGETDYRDLMRFTDAACEAFNFIDANRLGVTGGSYGGFMTNWIIGHTNPLQGRRLATQHRLMDIIQQYYRHRLHLYPLADRRRCLDKSRRVMGAVAP